MKKLLSLMVMLLTLTAIHAEDPDSLYAKDLLKPGTQAPDFDLKTADGKHITLQSLRGNYVVLDFWASWCPDCRKDIPAMKALFEKHKGKNITFVGISFDTNKETWTKCYWDKYQMNWTQVSELKKWKTETAIDKAYKVNWIPTMYLLDPDGRVLLSTVNVEKLGWYLDALPDKKTADDITPAQYVGGDSAMQVYLQRAMEYPILGIKNRASAKVTVLCNVEMDGAVNGARVIGVRDFQCTAKRLQKMDAEKRAEKEAKTLDALKAEAMRIVNLMPNWKPGTINGKPIQTQPKVTVTFSRKK